VLRPGTAFALCLVAAAARADVRATFRNDALADLDPPLDDDGFTNDLDFAFFRALDHYVLGGRLLHRWFTEPGGDRRWDQVELLATAERPWGRRVTISARLGPTAGGNWGGRWMQNGYHGLTRTGPTLDEGLPDRYPEGRTIGALAGGAIRGGHGVLDDHVRGFARLDGQLALFAGVSSIEGAVGGELVGRADRVEFGLHGELAVARYHESDAALALPGGYGTEDFEPAIRIGAHVAWGRVRLDYEYRSNEGGSGEPVGLVAFWFKQAGTSF
jgi:hypothetical protein